MNTMNFDAVFVTGLVRNNTTRYTLEEKILGRYKEFCKTLILKNQDVPTHHLYDEAAACLQKLMDNPEVEIAILKADTVNV